MAKINKVILTSLVIITLFFITLAGGFRITSLLDANNNLRSTESLPLPNSLNNQTLVYYGFSDIYNPNSFFNNYYSLNTSGGVIPDYSDNAPGSYAGTITLIPDRNGVPNSAYKFIPSSRVNATLGNSSQFNYNWTDTRTVIMWLNITNTTQPGNTYIFSKVKGGCDSSTYQWAVYLSTTSIGAMTDKNCVGTASATATYPVGSWFMVAAVWQANNSVDIYINGTKIASSGIGPTPGAVWAQSASLGSQLNSGGFTGWFDGTIDDVYVINRAMTPTEISNVYKSILNVNVVDNKGGIYNGTPINVTSTTNGIIDNAGIFNGINSQVVRGDYTMNSSSYTVSAWIYNPSYSSGERFVALDTAWELDLEANKYLIRIYNASTNEFISLSDTADPANDINKWTHVVAAVNSTSVVGYINGQKHKTSTISLKGLPILMSTLRIGTYWGGGDGYFNGTIDEVGIWNRTLNDSEVKELYNIGDGNKYPFSTVRYINLSNTPQGSFVKATIDIGSGNQQINTNYGFNAGSQTDLNWTGTFNTTDTQNVMNLTKVEVFIRCAEEDNPGSCPANTTAYVTYTNGTILSPKVYQLVTWSVFGTATYEFNVALAPSTNYILHLDKLNNSKTVRWFDNNGVYMTFNRTVHPSNVNVKLGNQNIFTYPGQLIQSVTTSDFSSILNSYLAGENCTGGCKVPIQFYSTNGSVAYSNFLTYNTNPTITPTYPGQSAWTKEKLLTVTGQDTGLLSYWNFENSSGVDRVAGLVNATLTGTGNTANSGKRGNSWSTAAGSGNYIITNTVPTNYMNFTSSRAFTGNFWLREDSNCGSLCNTNHIFDATAPVQNLNIFNYQDDNGGGNSIWAWNNSQAIYTRAATQINTGEWHMVTLTWNGTFASAYYDGNYLGGSVTTGGVEITGADFKLLANQGGTAESIDEMGIWNRTLSSAEITQLYNNGIGETFDDISSSIVYITVTKEPEMASNYGDVRFVDLSKANQLQYNLINYSSTEALFAVQTNRAKQIYMYYGGPTNVTTSNPSLLYWLSGLSTNLMSYWGFNENGGSVAADVFDSKNASLSTQSANLSLVEADSVTASGHTLGFAFIPNKNITLIGNTVCSSGQQPSNVVLRNSSADIIATSTLSSFTGTFNVNLVAGRKYYIEGNFSSGAVVSICTNKSMVPVYGKVLYGGAINITNSSNKGVDGNAGNYFLYSINGLNFVDNWVPGKIYSGVMFNGNDNYAQVNNITEPLKSNFSISVWMYPNSIIASHRVIEKGANTDWRLVTIDTSSVSFRNDSNLDSVDIPLSAGNWTHVVITYNGTTACGYKNGVFVMCDTFPIGSVSDWITIGNYGGTKQYGWNGTLDEIGIWTRVLTTNEISQLYNNGVGITLQSTNNVNTITPGLPGPTNVSLPNTTISPVIVSNASAALLIDGLKHQYTFDESSPALVSDSLGTNNLVNLPGTLAAGKLNNSYYSNDTNEGTNMSFSPVSVSNATVSVSFWFKRSGNWSGLGYYPAIVTSSSNANHWGVYGNQDNQNGGLFMDGGNCPSIASTPLNTWVFITAEWDFTTNLCTLYYNGVSQGTINFVSLNKTGNISLFSYTSGNNDMKYAAIDDLRFYGKLLSQTEINSIYNSGLGTETIYRTDVHVVNFTANATNDAGLSNATLTVTQQVSQGLCYQETANVSTVCGGLSTGTYGFVNALMDGNHSSVFEADGSYYFNYTKPASAQPDSMFSSWKFWAGGGWCTPSGPTIYQNNISLPSGCWNYSATKLLFRYNESTTSQAGKGGTQYNYWRKLQCFDGSNWNDLDNTDWSYTTGQIGIPEHCDARIQFSDESMYWNNGNSTTQILNQTTVNLGGVVTAIVSIPVSLMDGIYGWFWSVLGLDGGSAQTTPLNQMDLEATYPAISFVLDTPANGANVSTNILYLRVQTDANADTLTANAWAASTNPILSGLTSYWNFNEGYGTNTRDIIDGHNGQVTANWGAGKISNGLLFNGINTNVSVAGGSSIKTTELTISAWIKTNGSNSGHIVSKGNSGDYNYALRMNATGGVVEIDAWAIGGGRDSRYAISSSRVDDGQWHMVTGVLKNNSFAKIYVDGVLNGTNASAWNGDWNALGNADLYIGARADGVTPFNGSIDEVGIWYRALSDTEIQSLYNSGVGLNISGNGFTLSENDYAGYAGADNNRLCIGADYNPAFQTFTVGGNSLNTTMNLSMVSLKLGLHSTGGGYYPGNMTIAVYDAYNVTTPNYNSTVAIIRVDASTLNLPAYPAKNWYNFTMPAGTLLPGRVYALAANGTDGNPLECIEWKTNNNDNIYPYGGNNEQGVGGRDNLFAIYTSYNQSLIPWSSSVTLTPPFAGINYLSIPLPDDGYYYFNASATNSLGNLTSWTETRSMLADDSFPTGTVISPLNPSLLKVYENYLGGASSSNGIGAGQVMMQVIQIGNHTGIAGAVIPKAVSLNLYTTDSSGTLYVAIYNLTGTAPYYNPGTALFNGSIPNSNISLSSIPGTPYWYNISMTQLTAQDHLDSGQLYGIYASSDAGGFGVRASVNDSNGYPVAGVYCWNPPGATGYCGTSSRQMLFQLLGNDTYALPIRTTSNTTNFTINASDNFGIQQITLTLNNSAWYNSNWPYRKQISFTGGVITANYSVPITVLDSPYMNADYSDLFFTDSNNNALPYWIETYNATSAYVWVKVQNGNPILMYYGNPSTNSSSNINNTFLFGDDFSGTTLDASKWGIYLNKPYIVTNGTLILTTPDDWGHSIYSIQSFYSGRTQIIFTAKRDGDFPNERIGFSNATNYGADGGYRANLYLSSNIGADTNLEDGGAGIWFVPNQVLGNWYRWSLWNDGAYINGTETYSGKSAQLAYSNNRYDHLVLEGARPFPSNTTLDFIFIRNYNGADPRVTLGNEQVGVITQTYAPNTTSTVFSVLVYTVDGAYSWLFSIWDWANNLFQTPVNNLNVDTTTPVVNINYPLNGNNYSQSVTQILFYLSEANPLQLDLSINGASSTIANLTWYDSSKLSVNPLLPTSGNNSIWSNLFSYWRMDEGTGTAVNDVFGLNNGTTTGTWGTGLYGAATSYTVGQTTTIPDSSSLDFGASDGSISVWAYFPTRCTLDQCAIIDKRACATGNEDGYRIYFDDATHIKYAFSSDWALASVPSYPTNTWLHFVMTRRFVDASHLNVTLYYNGTAVGSMISTAGLIQNNPYNVKLDSGCAGSFSGKIDEVGMWNRALNSTEVSQLFNSGRGIFQQNPVFLINNLASANNSRTIWNLTLTNIAGVSSSSSVTFITDTFAPNITVISPNNVSVGSIMNISTLSLSAYFKLDELSGNAIEATNGIYNLTQFGTMPSSSGIIGNSRGPSGSSSNYLQGWNKTNDNVTNFDVNNFTVSLWAYDTNPVVWGHYISTILGPRAESGEQGFSFGNYDPGTSQKIILRFWDDVDCMTVITPNIDTTNRWIFWTFKRAGTNVTLWSNGAIVGSGTIAGTCNLTMAGTGVAGHDNSFRLGEQDDPAYGDYKPSNAKIDEVSIWKRALTDSEIVQLYNGGAGLTFGFVQAVNNFSYSGTSNQTFIVYVNDRNVTNDQIWNYRKQIAVNSTENITDYSIPLNISWSNGMQSNFGDLRFYDNNSNVLPYWIESYAVNSSANVWVKLNVTTGTNVIYVYYGNLYVNSTSNIANTFLVGDDFNAASFDTNKWLAASTGGSDCTRTQSNGTLSIVCPGVRGYAVLSQLNFSSNVGREILGNWTYFDSTGNGADNTYFGFVQKPLGTGARGFTNAAGIKTFHVTSGADDANNFYYRFINGGTFLQKYIFPVQWTRAKLYRNNTYASFYTNTNGTLISNVTAALGAGPWSGGVEVVAGNSYANMTIDWMAIRTATSTGVDLIYSTGLAENATQFIYSGLQNATLRVSNSTGIVNQSSYNLGGLAETTIAVPISLLDGIYNWFWSIFDFAGNQAVTPTYTTTIDTTNPNITFVNPTYPNGVNLSNVSRTIPIAVSITEPNLQSVDYRVWTNEGLLTGGTIVQSYTPESFKDTLGNSTNNPNGYGTNAVGSYGWSAYRFNATSTYILKMVKGYVVDYGGLSGVPVVVGIYPANATGGISDFTINGRNSTANSEAYTVGYHNWTFSYNDTLIEAGKQYWIVFFANNNANFFRFGSSVGTADCSGNGPGRSTANGRPITDLSSAACFGGTNANDFNIQLYGISSQYLTTVNMPTDNVYYYNVTATDVLGHIGSTETRTIRFDSLAPNMTIINPTVPVWLSGFNYRTPLTIVETSGSTLYNYTTQLSVVYNAHMNSNYSDLRFTDTTGTVLGYWIESYNATRANVWVKVPRLLASSSNTIYMYYGNTTAVTTSNKESAYLFSDDFGGAAINSTKWSTYIQAAGSITVSNNSAYLYHPSSAGSGTVVLLGNYTINSPVKISWLAQFVSCSFSSDLIIGTGTDTVATNYPYTGWDSRMAEYEFGCWANNPPGAATEYLRANNAQLLIAPTPAVNLNVSKTYSMQFIQASPTTYRAIYLDGAQRANATYSFAGTVYPVVATVSGSTGSSSNLSIKDYRMQTYSSSEPTVTFGSETTSIAGQTTYTNQTVTNFTINATDLVPGTGYVNWSSGLVDYWNFDSGYTSLRGISPDYNGGTTGAGVVGNGSLTLINAYIRYPASNYGSGSPTMSFGFWMNRTAINNGGISWWTSTSITNQNPEMLWYPRAGLVNLYILDGTDNTSPSNVNDIYADSKWHYYTYTTNGTTWTGYIDGVKVSNITTPAYLDNNNYYLFIGVSNDNTRITGGIDELSIWNRTLSTSEVSALYNNGVGRGYPLVTTASGLQNATLTITNNQGIVNQTTVNLGGLVTTTVTVPVSLLDGIYNWFWSLFDFAGNQATTQNNTLVVDTTAPRISFNTPPTYVNGANVSTHSVPMSVTIYDNNIANIVYSLYNSTWNNILTATPSGSSNWWNYNYLYRKDINVTAITNVGLANYTIPFNVSYAGVGKMKSDFSDLRFINASGSEMPYWIRDNYENSSAYVYVFIGNLVNQTIYMYYGNPSAASNSNIYNTFYFADDFDSPTLNTTLWTQNSGTTVQTGGQLIFSYTSGNPTILMNKPMSTATGGWESMTKFRFNYDSPSSYAWIGLFAAGGNTPIALTGDQGSVVPGKSYAAYNNAWDAVARTTDYSTRFYVAGVGANSTSRWHYDDGALVYRSTAQVGTYTTTGLQATGAGLVENVSWFFTRPVATVEPTITFGNEGGPTFSQTLSVPSDGVYYYNVSIVDYVGFTNSTEVRQITLDTANPNITIFSPNNVTTQPTLSGVKGYWKFDNSTSTTNISIDELGQNNFNLTYNNHWIPGKIKNAYYFGMNSTSNDFGTTDGTTLGKFGTGQFTIAFWMNSTSNAGMQAPLARSAGAINPGGWWVDLYQGNLRFDGNNVDFVCYPACSGATNYFTNNWHRIVITRDAANNITLYDNGALLTSTINGFDFNENTNILYVGTTSNGAQFYGSLDEVLITNESWAQSQVTSDYNSGAGKQYQVAPILVIGNQTYYAYPNQTFIVNVTDNLGIQNVTLNITSSTNQSYSYTNTTSYVPSTIVSTIAIPLTLADGVYNWFWTAYDWAANLFRTSTYQTIIDTTTPVLNFVSPTNPSGTNLSSRSFAVSVNVTEVNPASTTFNVWNSTWINSTTYPGIPFANAITYNNIPVIPTLTSAPESYPRGEKITMNKDACIVNVTIAPGLAATKLWIYNNSNSLLGGYDIVGGVGTANLPVLSGQTYKVLVNSTTAITMKYITGASYPQSATDFSWISAVYATFTDDPTTYSNIMNITTSPCPGAVSLINTVLSVPADGRYSYNVTVLDLTNHMGSTENRQITLDTTAPNATIISPAYKTPYNVSNLYDLSYYFNADETSGWTNSTGRLIQNSTTLVMSVSNTQNNVTAINKTFNFTGILSFTISQRGSSYNSMNITRNGVNIITYAYPAVAARQINLTMIPGDTIGIVMQNNYPTFFGEFNFTITDLKSYAQNYTLNNNNISLLKYLIQDNGNYQDKVIATKSGAFFSDSDYSQGIDLDYNSCGTYGTGGVFGYATLNYTKPYKANQAAISVKTSSAVFSNSSTPTSCWNYYPNNILYRVGGYFYGATNTSFTLDCYDGTWKNMINFVVGSATNHNSVCGQIINWSMSNDQRYLVLPKDKYFTNATISFSPISPNTLTNFGVSVGSGNTYYFNSTGNLTVSNRTSDFTSYLNTYLTGCTYLNGNCYIPINFYSSTSGNANYTLNLNDYNNTVSYYNSSNLTYSINATDNIALRNATLTIYNQTSATFNWNLPAYFKLDETSGSVAFNSAGGFNSIIDPLYTTVNQPGVIGTSYLSTSHGDGSHYSIVFNTTDQIAGTSWSISYWIYRTYGCHIGGAYDFETDDGTGNRLIVESCGEFTSDTHVSLYDGSSWRDFGLTLPNVMTGFHHIVVAADGVNGRAYAMVDGVLSSNVTYSPKIMKTTIGRGGFQGQPQSGKFDELAIFNRTLTPSEMTQLYNTGAGLAYSAPTAYNIVNQTTVDLGSLVQTIASVPVALADGIYNFFWTVYDWANNLFTTETRTINIDTINPFISFVYPLNGTTYTYVVTNSTITINEVNPLRLDVSVNGATPITVSSSSGYNAAYTTKALIANATQTITITNIPSVQGWNTYVFTVVDQVNHSTSVASNFFVDSVYPTASFVYPTDGNNSDIGRPYVRYNVTAYDVNLASVLVRLYNSIGQPVGNANMNITGPNITQGGNFSGLTSGDYMLFAVACDTLGNCYTTPTNLIHLDLFVPTVNFESPPTPLGNNLTTAYDLTNIEAQMNSTDLYPENMTLTLTGPNNYSSSVTETEIHNGTTYLANATWGWTAGNGLNSDGNLSTYSILNDTYAGVAKNTTAYSNYSLLHNDTTPPVSVITVNHIASARNATTNFSSFDNHQFLMNNTCTSNISLGLEVRYNMVFTPANGVRYDIDCKSRTNSQWINQGQIHMFNSTGITFSQLQVNEEMEILSDDDEFYNNFTNLTVDGPYVLTATTEDQVGNIVSINRTIWITGNNPYNMTYNYPTPLGGGITLSYIPINISVIEPNIKNITVRLFGQNGSIYNISTSGSYVNNFYTRFYVPDGQYFFNATAYDIYDNYANLPQYMIFKEYGAGNTSICKDISFPGEYTVVQNLNKSSGICLNILTSGVSIDCQGHSITVGDNGTAINSPYSNTVVKNCKLYSSDNGGTALKITGGSVTVTNSTLDGLYGTYVSDGSVTMSGSIISSNTYGIYVSGNGRASLNGVTFTDNTYDIYHNRTTVSPGGSSGSHTWGPSGAGSYSNIVFNGAATDIITLLYSDYNTFTNLTSSTGGEVRYTNSSNNLMSRGTLGSGGVILRNSSRNDKFLDTTYSGTESVDNSSQLIRSWTTTITTSDSGGSHVGGTTVHINDGSNKTVYTNPDGTVVTDVNQYINNGTITVFNPYEIFGVLTDYGNSLFTDTQITNVNGETQVNLTFSQRLRSTLLTRQVGLILMAMILLIGLAASTGFFIVKMRNGESVADIWKYFIIMMIWNTIFLVLFLVLGRYVMQFFYPT